MFLFHFIFFLWVDAGTLNDSRLNFWTWLKACREGGGGTVHYANEGPLKDRTLHEDMRVRGATVEFKGRLLPNQFLLHPSLWQPPPPLTLNEKNIYGLQLIYLQVLLYMWRRGGRENPSFKKRQHVLSELQNKSMCSFLWGGGGGRFRSKNRNSWISCGLKGDIFLFLIGFEAFCTQW